MGWFRQLDGWVEARRDRAARLWTTVAVVCVPVAAVTGHTVWLAAGAWFAAAATVLRYHGRNRL